LPTVPIVGSAQSTPPRSKLVLQVCVDSLFDGGGDQTKLCNPDPTIIPTPHAPLLLRPHKDVEPISLTDQQRTDGGHPQHGPLPFRTLPTATPDRAPERRQAADSPIGTPRAGVDASPVAKSASRLNTESGDRRPHADRGWGRPSDDGCRTGLEALAGSYEDMARRVSAAAGAVARQPWLRRVVEEALMDAVVDAVVAGRAPRADAPWLRVVAGRLRSAEQARNRRREERDLDTMPLPDKGKGDGHASKAGAMRADLLASCERLGRRDREMAEAVLATGSIHRAARLSAAHPANVHRAMRRLGAVCRELSLDTTHR
jgi:hypothetical protein